MAPRRGDFDESLAYTALLELGMLEGLTVADGIKLRQRFMEAYFAQDDVLSMFAFAKTWKPRS